MWEDGHCKEIEGHEVEMVWTCNKKGLRRDDGQTDYRMERPKDVEC